ncbi:hypothetical protein Scep_005365 [Stephania cephalantha]|uniref:Uncharacterized protein n=1 Tax=Stephania cephalantha TaxID=152367 RepID=A0AAP0KUF2_9MAGN
MARPKTRANRPPRRIRQRDQASTATSQVEEGVLKRKRLTCFNRKAKAGEAKKHRVNKESEPVLGDVVGEGIGTFSVSENGTLVIGRSGSGECTKGVHQPILPKKGMKMPLLIHRPVRQTQMPLYSLGRGFLKCINDGYQISAWKTVTQHPEKERVAKLI